jgi:2-amino-4-hydroxy-6-hydroxymethyldihydropteridine diphosphokinase
MIDAYIGIGSNLGDRLANVAAGIDAIAQLPDTRVAAVSRAYESEPWGPAGQPQYVNAVVHVTTDLYADQLLALLKDAEQQLGREPSERFGPRVIDFDILLFGDEEWDSDELKVPHPRMAEREFVIRPLLEIAPDVRYPDGSPVTAEGAREGRITDELGAVPGWEDATPMPQRQGPPAGAEPMGAPPKEARRPEEPGAAGQPQLAGDWVPLGVARLDGLANSVGDLIFLESVLKDAGIEVAFFPHRPNENFFNPYGISQYIQVYVPASKLREARDIARDVLGDAPIEE